MMNSPFSSPGGSYASDPTHLHLSQPSQPQDPTTTVLSSVAFPSGAAPATSPIVDSTNNNIVGGTTATRVIHTSPISRAHETMVSNHPDLNTCFSFDSRSNNNDSALLNLQQQPAYKTSPIGPRTGTSHLSRLQSSSSSSTSTSNNHHNHKRSAPENILFEPRPQNSPRTNQVTVLKSSAAVASNNDLSPTPPSKRLRRIQNAFEHLSIEKNSPTVPATSSPLLSSSFSYPPFHPTSQNQPQQQIGLPYLHPQTLDASPPQNPNGPIKEEQEQSEESVASMDATSSVLDEVSSIASSEAAPDTHGLPPILEKQKQTTTQNPVDAKIEEIIRKSRVKAEIASQKEQMIAAGSMDTDTVLTQDDFFVPPPHLAAKAGYQVPPPAARPQLRQRSNSLPFFSATMDDSGDDMAID